MSEDKEEPEPEPKSEKPNWSDTQPHPIPRDDEITGSD